MAGAFLVLRCAGVLAASWGVLAVSRSGLGELLGKSAVLGACGIKVGFGSFGPDAESGACFFEHGEPGIGGDVEFVALEMGADADAGDFLGGWAWNQSAP